MRLSPNGIALLQGFEGLSLTAYPDPKKPKVNGQWAPDQLWSIGYGHQLPPGTVWEGHTITRAQADELFRQDVSSREDGVSLLAKAPSQHQFDALVSLAYNIGMAPSRFPGSTVLRLHNAGDYAGAADAFRMWNKSAGAVSPVLVDRRERERQIYLRGYGPFEPPASSTPQSPAPSASSPSDGWSTTASSLPGSRGPLAIAAIVIALGGWLLHRLAH